MIILKIKGESVYVVISVHGAVNLDLRKILAV